MKMINDELVGFVYHLKPPEELTNSLLLLLGLADWTAEIPIRAAETSIIRQENITKINYGIK